MKNNKLLSVSLSAVVLAGTFLSLTGSLKTVSSGDDIRVCHATNSSSNPYINNNPDKSANVGGHDGHNGGVFPADPWGDIIPPFEYDGGSYPGKNWTDEGQAVWNNNCRIPAAPVLTSTPTVTPILTSTPTPIPTATIAPTATPSATLTVTPTATPVLTAEVASPTPTSEPESTGAVLGTSTENEQEAKGMVLGTSTLAETGSKGDKMIMLGTFILILTLYAAKAKKSYEIA